MILSSWSAETSTPLVENWCISCAWDQSWTPVSYAAIRDDKQVAKIVDRHFKRWYNKPPLAKDWQKTVDSAKIKALSEVDALLLKISRAAT